MIRISEIQEALFHLIGWHQDYNPAKYISSTLLSSESGLYYQDAHPLMTLDNIRSIMPLNYADRYPAWTSIRTYTAGDKVQYDNIIWIATRENKNSVPPSSDFNDDYSVDFGGAWNPFNPVTDFISQLVNTGIMQTVQTFLQMKSLLRESKNLLEHRTFFDGSGRINNTQANQGKLVGFEINPVRAMGVTAKIERIGLQMKGAAGSVTVYLFHSSQADPIKTQTFNVTKGNGSFEWFYPTDWYMPYIGSTNAGGSWYLVYNQNDLPDGMEAINVAKDWSREPCGTCNIGSVEGWRELTKYLSISPFKITATEDFAEYPELWDVRDNVYTNACNYGMNVEVSVACDLTDFIISQRQMFATVLLRQVAANALRTMAMNPDVAVNRHQSNVSAQGILYELDGNTEGREGGLGYELRKAYEAIDLDTRNIDRICLTCRPVGLKYRTV